MKKKIYLIKFIDDTTHICRSRKEILEKISIFLESLPNAKSLGYYKITIYMLDCLIYNRVQNKEKQRYIKYFGICDLKDLVTINRNLINKFGFDNKPFTTDYVRRQEIKQADKLFSDAMKNNAIDFNRFETLLEIV